MHTRPLMLLACVMGHGLLMTAAPLAVHGATAVAMVAVTIMESHMPRGDLAFSTAYVDLRGKASEELVITNQSGKWREFRAELTSQEHEEGGCTVHYSPKHSVIPPGGTQILRLLVKRATQSLCQVPRRMVFSDPQSPAAPVYLVDIYSDGI